MLLIVHIVVHVAHSWMRPDTIAVAVRALPKLAIFAIRAHLDARFIGMMLAFGIVPI
jgi:hypothetical protein